MEKGNTQEKKNNFSWVNTYMAIADALKPYETQQTQLIEIIHST
ncbi:hypothetical protein [Lacticaseibacillus camelliae]|nr:hypothetical protein [Lacticaseibacillus camelliae]